MGGCAVLQQKTGSCSYAVLRFIPVARIEYHFELQYGFRTGIDGIYLDAIVQRKAGAGLQGEIEINSLEPLDEKLSMV